jgi:predicted amidohydrolase/ribosomal protein S18 acetylase RimI-like enzyme
MPAEKKNAMNDYPDLEKHERKVTLRRLRLTDYPAVNRVQNRVFHDIEPWTEQEFASQLRTFPAGQLGVEIDGDLVAISSSLIVSGDVATSAHDFEEITDDGWILNHREDGDYLYGIDIAIAPEYQGFRLARRLYEARKGIVARRNLKGMVIGGRIPGYGEHADEMSAEEYVERVLQRELNDPVLVAQIANGFEVKRVIPDYLPEDRDSQGHAVLLEWRNPDYAEKTDQATTPDFARVCVVQYQMRQVTQFDEFTRQCEYFVDTASDYRCDFVLFPELLTTQLLSLVDEKRPQDAARKLNRFTDPYLEFFTELAIRYNINIVGGSHLTVEDERLYNVAFLFRRDGTIARQYKLHITPSEAKWWGVSPGDKLHVIDTDRGKVAILTCYDIEFPELARVAVEKGARILFVPYNTDMRSGHLRVRTCAQARCIENHCYVAMSGATGNLPAVEAADIHYAQSGIFTPSDISFDRDGIAAECTPNVEMVVMHDLDLNRVEHHRRYGTVRNWLDRRTDIYRVRYDDGDEELEI